MVRDPKNPGEGDPSCDLTVDEGPRLNDFSTLDTVVGDVSEQSRQLSEPEDAESRRLDLVIVEEQAGRYGSAPDASGEPFPELGRGGIGRVLLAFDRAIGREVAIKELLQSPTRPSARDLDLASSLSQAESRFLREAHLTGQLEHPNIVPVYDFGARDDGRLYYSMKLVRGATLADAIEAAVTFEQRVKLLPRVVDLCNAIAYAHSRGVVHRDIKPANVMLGEFGETLVLDWGLAKAQGMVDDRGDELPHLPLAQSVNSSLTPISQGPSLHETIDGVVVGTPAYMSPEAASGRVSEIDARSDVWSLGAVLFEVLTRRRVFLAESGFMMLVAISTEVPPNAHEVDPEVPPAIAAVVAKALAREPTARYQSAKELADEIERFLSGLRVEAYQYPLPEILARFARKHRALLAVSLVAVLGLFGLGLFAHLRVTEQRDRAVEAEHSARVSQLLAEDREAQARISLAESLELHAASRDGVEASLFAARALTLQERPLARGILMQVASAPLVRELWHLNAASDDTLVDGLSPTDALFDFDADSPHKKLVVSTQSGMIAIYGARPDTAPVLERTFRAHGTTIYGVALAADGTLLATTSADASVRLWRFPTGEPLRTLEGSKGSVFAVDIAADGARVAAASEDGGLYVWDTTTGLLEMRLGDSLDSQYAVAFHPDGVHLLGGSTGGHLEVFDLAQRVSVTVVEAHQGPINAIVFSPDGKRFATAGMDAVVKLWDATSLKAIAELEGHTAEISSLSFNADGSLLASVSADRTARVWEVGVGELARLPLHSAGLIGATFTQDQLTTVTTDGHVQVWSIPPRDMATLVPGHAQAVWRLAFSPDGRHLATPSSDRTVRLFRIVPSDEAPTLAQKSDERVLTLRGQVFDVDWSPDGRQLAVAGADRGVHLYDAEGGTAAAVLDDGDGELWTVAWSRDGQRLAEGGVDRVVRVWNVAGKRVVFRLEGHTESIWGLAFSPDGRTLASASVDDTVRIWDLESGRELEQLAAHKADVADVAYSADGSQLVSASLDGALCIWNTTTWELERRIETGSSEVWSLAWQGGVAACGLGDVLATASVDQTVRLWEPSTGVELARLPTAVAARGVALSSDLRWLAAGLNNGQVQMWSLATFAKEPAAWAQEVQRTTGLVLNGSTITTAPAQSEVRQP